MFLQNAFYISLYLFAASIAILLNPNPDFDNNHLPTLRLSREEVQAIKKRQTDPPGYIHEYDTLTGGKSTPIVEVEADTLLNNNDGDRARSLAPRGNCLPIPNGQGNCNINYCWTGTDGTQYTEAITIEGSDGSSNPTSMTTSNRANIYLSGLFNTGYNHWFPLGHECSNDNTETYTMHRMNEDEDSPAHITDLNCKTCDFGSLICSVALVNANLVASTDGGAGEVPCASS
jgi:hypothetical protein